MKLRVFRLLAAVMLLLAVLAGCTQAPVPTAQPAPAAPTQPPAPAATSVPPTATLAPPTATPVPPTATVPPPTATKPAPTATKPVPTAAAAAPAIPATKPDPEEDPMGALLWASAPQNWQSATFAYTMTMKMKPADDASAKAMGDAAAQLAGMQVTATGEGAMEVVDAEAGKSNSRMNFDMDMMGQKMTIQMVQIGSDVWMRLGSTGPWQKAPADQASSALPGGNPAEMVETFKNATDARYVKQEKLDGEDVHHIQFTMDPRDWDTSALNLGTGGASPEQMEAMLKDMTIDVDAWLAVGDLTLRQENMLLSMVIPVDEDTPDMKLRADIDMTMRFSDINEPVTIEPPKE